MRVAHSLGARGIEGMRYSRLFGFIQGGGNEHPRGLGHRRNVLVPLLWITQYGSSEFLRRSVHRRNSLLPCLCIHENSTDFVRCSGHRRSSLLLCVWIHSKWEKRIPLELGGQFFFSHSCSCGFAKKGIPSTVGVPKGNSSLAFLDERTQAKDPKQTFPSKRSQAEDSNREIPSQRSQAEHSKRSCWTNPGYGHAGRSADNCFFGGTDVSLEIRLNPTCIKC